MRVGNNASTSTTLLATNATCAYAVNFTPAADGAIQGKLTITDNSGTAFGTSTNASQIVPLNGTGVGSVAIAVTGTVPAATVSLNYTGSFSASGGLAPYTYAATGLPPGLVLSASGALTGTPTTAGSYTINVTATDADSFTGSASFPLTVAAPSSIVVTGALPAATAGVSYTGSFAAAGGTAPYSFSATGLPPGLTLSTAGALTGTPTTSGSYTIKVAATDSNSFTGSASFPLTVAASTADFQLSLINGGAQMIAAGSSAQYTLSVSPASGSFPFPVSFTVSGLPGGYTEVFSPVTVTPGSNTVQTQLTVHSNTTFSSLRTSNPYGIVLAFVMLPLFGLRKLRRSLSRSLLAVLLLSCGLAATVGLTGCVGNHTNPATYNVVITGTGNNFQHSVTTMLKVQ